MYVVGFGKVMNVGYLVYIGVCPSIYTLFGSEMSAFCDSAASDEEAGVWTYCLFG